MPAVSYSGARVNSKVYRPESIEIDPELKSTHYEGIITGFFLPWLIEDIPDCKWRALQENLGRVIVELLSKREQAKTKGNQ